MKLPSIHTITECKQCKSNVGFYVKSRVSGEIEINYSFDGTGSDNVGMYDNVRHDDKKYAYCQDCHTTIGIWDDESKRVVPSRVKMSLSAF